MDRQVVLGETLCNGCRACAKTYTFDAPHFSEDNVLRKYDLCVDSRFAGADPPCVDTCPGNK